MLTLWKKIRLSEEMCPMQSQEENGQLHPLLLTALLTLLLSIALVSCGFLQTTQDILITAQELVGGNRRASVKIEKHEEDVTVIRTYPGSVITLLPQKDSTYRLNSGDMLTLRWLGDKAILVCEIVPDTVKINPKKP